MSVGFLQGIGRESCGRSTAAPGLANTEMMPPVRRIAAFAHPRFGPRVPGLLLAAGTLLHPAFLRAQQPPGRPSAPAAETSLLSPAGRFPIGTTTVHWTDHSRREKASRDPAALRELTVQIWYPAAEEKEPLAPYVEKIAAYEGVWDRSRVDAARRTITHSHRDAVPAPRRAPVVLLSHGWGGTRSGYTTLAESLASRGYAVFGVDHPYMGRVAMPDGSVTEPTETQFATPFETAEYYADDLRFVIRKAEALGRSEPDGRFAGKLDLSRIAAIGHSSGFLGAHLVCKTEPRVKACVNVDAPGYPAGELTGIRAPLLWIELQKAGPLPRAFLESLRAPACEVQVEGAAHGSIADWDYVEAATDQERSRAGALLEIELEAIGAFLDRFVREEKTVSVGDKEMPRDPRVRVTWHMPR